MTAQTTPALTSTVAADTAGYEILARLRLADLMAARGADPVLGSDALVGLAGEIVHQLAPGTEATPAAMLATVLTAFGAMCGRHAHVMVGAKPHYPNIFTVIVGGTSKDRKGTSAAAVRPILDAVDTGGAAFMTDRQLVGIQSGEALIQAAAQVGGPAGPGAPALFGSSISPSDQRLLVYEEEYAGRMLTVAGRRDSILSAVLRSAWDGEPLASRTRREDLRAAHAHIGVLAHVTQDELLSKMTDVDVANGYTNRFLHVLSRRTSYHSNPDRLPDEQVRQLGDQLAEALTFARATGEVTRTTEFNDAWDTLYRVVESQPSGGRMYDRITARATAHLLRLSLLYALLDRSPVLRGQHLRSATALWDYCDATVAHIWGATLGDPKLDRLFSALAAAGATGLTRTDISGLFSNNASKGDLDRLIGELVAMGVARTETRRTGGRPSLMLFAVDA